jgi:hypothetical protein
MPNLSTITRPLRQHTQKSGSLRPPRGRRGGSPIPSRSRSLPAMIRRAAARAGRRVPARPQGQRRHGLPAPLSRGPGRARPLLLRRRGPPVGPPPGGGGWCIPRSGGALPGSGGCMVGAPRSSSGWRPVAGRRRWWPWSKMAARRRVDGGVPTGGRCAPAVAGAGRRLGGGLAGRRPCRSARACCGSVGWRPVLACLGWLVSHPDLRTNPNARIHVRQDQVTHMHRRSEYQNTV